MNAVYKIPHDAEEWKEVGETGTVAATMKEIGDQVADVLDGRALAVFVFGGAGMGKNHIVARELKKRGLDDAKPISPRDKTDLLRQFHHATFDMETMKKRPVPLPMFFDEAGLIFKTAPNLDIMKMATDTGDAADFYDSGYIWFSEGEEYEGRNGEIKYRQERHQGTSLRAPIIAMTNMNLNEFPKAIRDSATALSGRAPPIEITANRIELWKYSVFVALTTDLLTAWKGPRAEDGSREIKRLSLQMRSDVLDFFTDNLFKLKWASVRGLEKVRDAFVLAKDSQSRATKLSLLILPENQQEDGRPPRNQDWRTLRIALETKLPPKVLNPIERVPPIAPSVADDPEHGPAFDACPPKLYTPSENFMHDIKQLLETPYEYR